MLALKKNKLVNIAESTATPVGPVVKTPAAVAKTVTPVAITVTPVAITSKPAMKTVLPVAKTAAPAAKTAVPVAKTVVPFAKTAAQPQATPSGFQQTKGNSRFMPKVRDGLFYHGDNPSGAQTLAKIYTVAGDDHVLRDALVAQYEQERSTVSSQIRNPYTVATGKGPVAKANSARLAYEESLWGKEIVHYTKKGYSDAEIHAKFDAQKYPTLAQADIGRQSGKPLALEQPTDYDEDFVVGTAWAARNGGGTGSLQVDAIKSYLGDGNTYRSNRIQEEYRNPGSPAYKPYRMATDDDLCIALNVNHIDQNWVNENRDAAYAEGVNSDFYKNLTRAYVAVKTTEAAKTELTSLYAIINERLQTMSDPRQVLEGLEGAFPHLAQMDAGRAMGKPLVLTEPVDYRWEDMQSFVRRKCNAKMIQNTGLGSYDPWRAVRTNKGQNQFAQTQAAVAGTPTQPIPGVAPAAPSPTPAPAVVPAQPLFRDSSKDVSTQATYDDFNQDELGYTGQKYRTLAFSESINAADSAKAVAQLCSDIKEANDEGLTSLDDYYAAHPEQKQNFAWLEPLVTKATKQQDQQDRQANLNTVKTAPVSEQPAASSSTVSSTTVPMMQPATSSSTIPSAESLTAQPEATIKNPPSAIYEKAMNEVAPSLAALNEIIVHPATNAVGPKIVFQYEDTIDKTFADAGLESPIVHYTADEMQDLLLKAEDPNAPKTELEQRKINLIYAEYTNIISNGFYNFDQDDLGYTGRNYRTLAFSELIDSADRTKAITQLCLDTREAYKEGLSLDEYYDAHPEQKKDFAWLETLVTNAGKAREENKEQQAKQDRENGLSAIKQVYANMAAGTEPTEANQILFLKMTSTPLTDADEQDPGYQKIGQELMDISSFTNYVPSFSIDEANHTDAYQLEVYNAALNQQRAMLSVSKFCGYSSWSAFVQDNPNANISAKGLWKNAKLFVDHKWDITSGVGAGTVLSNGIEIGGRSFVQSYLNFVQKVAIGNNTDIIKGFNQLDSVDKYGYANHEAGIIKDAQVGISTIQNEDLREKMQKQVLLPNGAQTVDYSSSGLMLADWSATNNQRMREGIDYIAQKGTVQEGWACQGAAQMTEFGLQFGLDKALGVLSLPKFLSGIVSSVFPAMGSTTATTQELEFSTTGSQVATLFSGLWSYLLYSISTGVSNTFIGSARANQATQDLYASGSKGFYQMFSGLAKSLPAEILLGATTNVLEAQGIDGMISNVGNLESGTDHEGSNAPQTTSKGNAATSFDEKMSAVFRDFEKESRSTLSIVAQDFVKEMMISPYLKMPKGSKEAEWAKEQLQKIQAQYITDPKRQEMAIAALSAQGVVKAVVQGNLNTPKITALQETAKDAGEKNQKAQQQYVLSLEQSKQAMDSLVTAQSDLAQNPSPETVQAFLQAMQYADATAREGTNAQEAAAVAQQEAQRAVTSVNQAKNEQLQRTRDQTRTQMTQLVQTQIDDMKLDQVAEERLHQKQNFVPYTGETPLQPYAGQSALVAISDNAYRQVSRIITNAQSNAVGGKGKRVIVKKALEAKFGDMLGDVRVEIEGVTYHGRPYTVKVGHNLLEKLAANPALSAEKLAVLDNMESVIENARYESTSGVTEAYAQKTHVMRYDHFTCAVVVNGKMMEAKLLVEVVFHPDRGNTCELSDIDLTRIATSGTLSGGTRPEAAPSVSGTPSFTDSIAQAGLNRQEGEQSFLPSQTNQTQATPSLLIENGGAGLNGNPNTLMVGNLPLHLRPSGGKGRRQFAK